MPRQRPHRIGNFDGAIKKGAQQEGGFVSQVHLRVPDIEACISILAAQMVSSNGCTPRTIPAKVPKGAIAQGYAAQIRISRVSRPIRRSMAGSACKDVKCD
jgi:hypothetical protein